MRTGTDRTSTDRHAMLVKTAFDTLLSSTKPFVVRTRNELEHHTLFVGDLTGLGKILIILEWKQVAA